MKNMGRIFLWALSGCLAAPLGACIDSHPGALDTGADDLADVTPSDSKRIAHDSGGDTAPDLFTSQEDSAVVSHTRLIKVLAFNIHARLTIPDNGQFQEIGEILAERRAKGDEPDFVLLQEMLVPAADEVQKYAHYPFEVKGPPAVGIKVLGSGLVTLSKHPILWDQQMVFNDCALNNCFANKGVLAVQVQPAGMPRPVMIINTHMQSQEEHDDVRVKQMDQTAAFLQQAGYLTTASIFAGDFNTKPKRPSYPHFLAVTPYIDAGKFCLDDPGICTIEVGMYGYTDLDDVWEGTNDGHFFHAPTISEYEIQPVFLTLNFTEKGKDYYSDHWGYEVHYRFSW